MVGWRLPRPLCGLEEALSFSKLAFSLRKTGAPERIRTSDPQIRSLVLYPAELRALLEARSYIGEPLQRQAPSGPQCRPGAAPLPDPAPCKPSTGGNVQISTPSGIVLPCPLPPRWLRLAAKVRARFKVADG